MQIYVVLFEENMAMVKTFLLTHSDLVMISYLFASTLSTFVPPGVKTGSKGLLPDMQNCGLRMRRECRERFPRHRLQRKPLVSDPAMYHDTCVTHVPWCISGFLTRGGGENVRAIPGACATRNFTYLVRGPLKQETPRSWLDCTWTVSYKHDKNLSWLERKHVWIKGASPDFKSS